MPFIVHWDGIEYGSYINKVTSKKEYSFYFYWWHWLPKSVRYWGYEMIQYDGAHESFGLWFTNLSWSTAGSYRRLDKQLDKGNWKSK